MFRYLFRALACLQPSPLTIHYLLEHGGHKAKVLQNIIAQKGVDQKSSDLDTQAWAN